MSQLLGTDYQSIGDPGNSQQVEVEVQRKNLLPHKIHSAQMFLCTDTAGKQTCRLMVNHIILPCTQIHAPTWLTEPLSQDQKAPKAQVKPSSLNRCKSRFDRFQAFESHRFWHFRDSSAMYCSTWKKGKWLANVCSCTIRCMVAETSLTSVVLLILQKKKKQS